MTRFAVLSCVVALCATLLNDPAFSAELPMKLGLFPQEVAFRYTTADGLPGNNVYAVHIAPSGAVYVSTNQGLARFDQGRWTSVRREDTTDFSGEYLDRLEIEVQPDGVNQLAAEPRHYFTEPMPLEPVNDLAVRGEIFVVAGREAQGFFWKYGLEANEFGEEDIRVVHQLARGPRNRLAVATDRGLLLVKPGVVAEYNKMTPIIDPLGRDWGAGGVLGVCFDRDGRLWIAAKAGLCREDTAGWRFWTAEDGLPYNDFTCLAAGPDGEIWLGTRLGAIRFDGEQWAYRQGPAWLPLDDVRDIAVDDLGNAWFATPAGVGRIERRPMTLKDKAVFYEEEIDRYIKRTPYGYTSEVSLARAGDKSRVIQTDSDNDGLWTSMYGAGECFAYAATQDPAAKERARQAFDALRFLQKVTQDCAHSPPKGFVARTILPADGPDPNVGRIEADREKREKEDPLWKVYEPRWPRSADGKWYWKSDTSSDELDGHFFFYPAYYDLVADTEEERERVREVVRDLTDHLIEHDYSLVDHDGTPTRWAIYGPQKLNHDLDWWNERGLKSLSILSYLAVAEHVTGDPKYGRHIDTLVNEHAYDANLLFAKVQHGVGAGNQSDDEMAIMCFYNLLKYVKNERARQKGLYAFYLYWMIVQPERNPFFHFAYAAFGHGAKWTNPWGTWSITPWPGWLEDSVGTLKGFSLDRCNWPHINSHRLDVIPLRRQQAVEPYEPMRGGRGHLLDGKVLQVENRHFSHWNTDPWRLDYHGDGRELSSGAVFLLPYYMGLYHGFIEESE